MSFRKDSKTDPLEGSDRRHRGGRRHEPRARVRAALGAQRRAVAGSTTHRDADITFDKDYSLDLGGVKAKIIAMGTNHTHGDTVVLVDGVLFSGDVAMRPQPSFANPTAKISHWLESLDQLEALKPKQLVPSHGAFGDISIIAGYRTYLTRIRDRAAELKKAGKTQDETIQIDHGRNVRAVSGQEPARGCDPRGLQRSAVALAYFAAAISPRIAEMVAL